MKQSCWTIYSLLDQNTKASSANNQLVKSYCARESLNRARPGHECYPYRFIDALHKITRLGLPRVSYAQDIDCTQSPSLRLGTVQPISGIRNLDSLEEALEELRRHLVGCTLVVYPSIWHNNTAPELLQGLQIYEGPDNDYLVNAEYCNCSIESHASIVPGMGLYHAVILIKILQIDGRLLGLVKMSNGLEVGYDGYVLVCLNTMYMLAYFSDDLVRAACMLTPRPTRLLTHFVVVDMFEREGFITLPRHMRCFNPCIDESQTNTPKSFEFDGVVESIKGPAETGAVDASMSDKSMSTHQESIYESI